MPQPSFKADVVQIQPSTAGTRTLSCSADGELQFVDPIFPSGLVLSDLAGLQTFPNVALVAKGGGAQFTTIQEAVDAIPVDSATPYVVMVYSGVYAESLLIDKNLTLLAMGPVTITNDTGSPTVHIVETSTSIPTTVSLVGLTIVAEGDGAACVSVDGTDTVATGSVDFVLSPLAVGDTLTIGGVELVAVAGARTSGSNTFNGSLSPVSSLAAEIVAAINDENNGFSSMVVATRSGNTVVLEAAEPGSEGNTITLESDTVDMVVSGATLTGGGGLNSLVASGRVLIERCDLVASGVGSRQVLCDTVGSVWVVGGSWAESNTESASLASQTAEFRLTGVVGAVDLEYAFNTAAVSPATAPVGFFVSGVSPVRNVLANVVGGGTVVVESCPQVQSVAVAGDRTLSVRQTTLVELNLAGAVEAAVWGSQVGSIVAVDDVVVNTDTVTGFVVFDGESSRLVELNFTFPDVSYMVSLESPSLSTRFAATDKTVTGFTIEASGVYTGSVWYRLSRILS